MHLREWAHEVAELCLRHSVVCLIDPATAPAFAHVLLARVGVATRGPIAFGANGRDLAAAVGDEPADLAAYLRHAAPDDAKVQPLVFVLADGAASVFRWTRSGPVKVAI